MAVMPATFTPGSAFRVSAEGDDYSSRVTGGGIDSTPNKERIRTLTAVVYPQSDVEDTFTVEWLYDEDEGLYGFLFARTRTESADPFSVEIVGGASKWTCDAAHIMGTLSAPFTAEDGATRASVTLAGVVEYGPA